MIRKLLAENQSKRALEECTLKIEPDSIETISSQATGKIRWSGVMKVETTDEYGYIYLSPTSAIIVPKRVFPDSSMFNEFVSLAKTYHQASLQSP